MRTPDTARRLLIGLGLLGMVAGCGVHSAGTVPAPAAGQAPDFAECLVRHLENHPLAAAEDVYKFVHQSVAGPGHLIPDSAEALAYLQQEIANLEESAQSEPLYENLGGEPDLVRLNLRPFTQSGGDPQRLVDAMVSTADSVVMDEAELARRLDTAASLLAERGRDDDSKALADVLAELAGRGYPAIHHSDSYSAAYRPAYRVVSRKLADSMAGELLSTDPPRAD